MWIEVVGGIAGLPSTISFRKSFCPSTVPTASNNSSEVSLNRIVLICGKRPVFYRADVTDQEAIDIYSKAIPISILLFIFRPLRFVALSHTLIVKDHTSEPTLLHNRSQF